MNIPPYVMIIRQRFGLYSFWRHGSEFLWTGKMIMFCITLSTKEVRRFNPFRSQEGKISFNLTLICSLITVFIGILYFNSLGNQFTNWDDGMIYQNNIIRNLNWITIQKIFTYEKSNTYQP